MQVVVKKPHIKIDGEITEALLNYIRSNFSEVEIIENKDDELIEITKSSWYKQIKKETTPGDNLRIYRELHGFTQAALGKKVGGLTRQNISNMERGQRSISKFVAKKLAYLFDVSVEKFL